MRRERGRLVAARTVDPGKRDDIVDGGFTGSADDSTSTTTGEMALSADSLSGDHDANNNFIDSIGVNTKFTYSNSVYTNYNAVKAALLGLGVRHIRDAFNAQRDEP